ncbi:MAG: hypothetical protein GXO66_04130 [Euryarchaeota archaeon]|nr:hypothetical protein [Euryarchaeota archaeon]
MRLLLLFLLISPGAFSQPAVSVDLLDGGKARITYLVEGEAAANLSRQLRNPMVQAAVGERMASLFCWEVEDFFIVPGEEELRIVVDCRGFARRSGGTWRTEGRNLSGVVPLTIKISLPPGAELVASHPPPHRVVDGSLVWREVTYLPAVEYRQGAGLTQPQLLLIIAAFLAAILLAWARSRRR